MSKKPAQSPQLIFAYVPVLHQGYLGFFAKYPGVKTLLLPDQELLHSYRPLVKDLRALDPKQMKIALDALGLFERVGVCSAADLQHWNSAKTELIAPDEDINHQLIGKYIPKARVQYDPIFLRWDAVRTAKVVDVQPDTEVSSSKIDQEFMAQAELQAQRSPDWWRQVGGVLVKDGKIIIQAYNRHLPQENQHYSNGDPRANFQSGQSIEFSTSLHTEASLIAQAAQQGVSVAGASLYCTTFPCPVCAKLVAASGIAKVYYTGGYAVVDGEDVLKAAGVELIRVTA